jgi:hypothetical protein
MYSEHDQYCNCYHCWWIRDQKEICGTCGSIIGAGCPCVEVVHPPPIFKEPKLNYKQKPNGEFEMNIDIKVVGGKYNCKNNQGAFHE